MKIIRVFPRETSYTPNDDYCFFGYPPFAEMIPPHDEVHVSCTFTWDRPLARELAFQWGAVTDKPVKLGGVAYKSPATDFVQGLYMKRNIIFTTRGCNNHCPWCFVPGIEGGMKHLPVVEGNIIQDNNFLQANADHKRKVYEMLRTQRGIAFRGGLEPDLLDDDFVENIQQLRISELWLACDTNERLPLFHKGVEKLVKAGFGRGKIYCYALSYGKDMEADEARCIEIFKAGAMPFVQLYMDDSETKKRYPKEWTDFQRNWSRPAIIKARMKELGYET